MNTIVCYFISSVITLAHMNGVPDTKLTYGAKQIVTELVNDKYALCDDGRPVTVEILSIEAPTKGIRVGPFEFKQKKTVVKIPVRVIIFSGLIFFAILDYNVSDSFLE